MPYITDPNDFITITEEQNSQLFALHYQYWVLGLMAHPMGLEELQKKKDEIVKNSEGYVYICNGLKQGKLCKEILI